MICMLKCKLFVFLLWCRVSIAINFSSVRYMFVRIRAAQESGMRNIAEAYHSHQRNFLSEEEWSQYRWLETIASLLLICNLRVPRLIVSVEFFKQPTCGHTIRGHIQTMQSHDIIRLISNVSYNLKKPYSLVVKWKPWRNEAKFTDHGPHNKVDNAGE